MMDATYTRSGDASGIREVIRGMGTGHLPRHVAILSAVACLFLSLSMARGQAQGTQVLQLQKGWNAVYLEVDPSVSDPDKVFAGLPVTVVAAYSASPQGAQFVQDPSAKLLKAYGWSVWYSPDRPDAFLGTLHAIYGGRAYLIQASRDTAWTVHGTLSDRRVRWLPDAYNFVGFSVLTPGGPTFSQFFEDSAAHVPARIYRMVGGVWKRVLDPDAVAMRSGEAFWMYCKGKSDYPGPLEVQTASHLGLVLSSESGAVLVLRNRTSKPLALQLEHTVVANAPVPLSVPVKTFDAEAKGLRTARLDLGGGNWVQKLPTLAGGAAMQLPLEIRLHDMEPGTRHSVLTVHTDLGTLTPVSVTASRDD